MKKKYSVFISSTFVDLENERETIRKLVIDMGYIPLGMESFPASNEEQFAYIQKVIDDSDYYILVIGARYGSVTNDGLSYTEKEYDYAVAKKKVVLAFINDTPGDFPAKVLDNDPLHKEKLEQFKTKASTGRIVCFWNNPNQLGYKAMTSLHQAVDSYPTIGWVRGDFKNTQEVSNEFVRVEAESFHLKNEVKDLRSDLETYKTALLNQLMDRTKPATQAEVDAWLEGAKLHYKDMKYIRASQVRYVDKDIVLPALYGANSVSLLVKEGVKIYQVDSIGHSEIMYMDGFRIDGI